MIRPVRVERSLVAPISSILAGLIVLASAGAARADEFDCGLAAADLIVVDGMLDDWQGVAPARQPSFTLRCNYDPTHLYLAVDVADEVLDRSRKGGAGEDHLVITLGPRRLVVFPAKADAGARQVATWGGKALGRKPVVQVADSLQPRGWSVEVGIPLARVPGWGKGVPALPLEVAVTDSDPFTDQRRPEVISTGPSRIVFQEGAELLRAVLAETKLRRQDLTLDTLAEMDGAPGLERVIAGGKIVAVLSEDFTVLNPPVASKKDLLEVRVVDLAGAGKSSLLLRYVERGGGGSREVLAVYNLKSDSSIARTFAHEIGKQLGAAKITNTWTLGPRAPEKGAKGRKGKKGGKGKKGKGGKGAKPEPGLELVITPGEVVGFDKDSWNEVPAEDMQPILLPWGDKQEERWTFSGDEAFGGDPAAGTR